MVPLTTYAFYYIESPAQTEEKWQVTFAGSSLHGVLDNSKIEFGYNRVPIYDTTFFFSNQAITKKQFIGSVSGKFSQVEENSDFC